MFTTIVQFPLPAAVSAEQFRETCRHIAPDFRTPVGLLSKQFLLGHDGRSGGGVYLWVSRADAERFHAAGFRVMIRKLFGAEPTITHFETPVVVDNRAAA